MAKMSSYAAIALGAVIGTSTLPIRDLADLSMGPTGTTKQVSAANLRTALLGGGTGYTATDPLACGTGVFSGDVTPNSDNTRKLGTAALRWSDVRAVIGTISGAFTVGGLLQTAASASGGAGLNLPHGAAPSAPVNGDIWTTSSSLFVRLNGTTRDFRDMANFPSAGALVRARGGTGGYEINNTSLVNNANVEGAFTHGLALIDVNKDVNTNHYVALVQVNAQGCVTVLNGGSNYGGGVIGFSNTKGNAGTFNVYGLGGSSWGVENKLGYTVVVKAIVLPSWATGD